MKKCMLLAVFVALSTTCVNVIQKTRTAQDIFCEIANAIADTTSSVEQVSVLFAEYADTLYSMTVSSDIGNVATRAEAQYRAMQALGVSIDYLVTERGDSDNDVPMKFYKVLNTWKVVPHPSGNTYVKEIFFYAGKDTDRGKKEIISVLVRTGEDAKTRIILPKGEMENYPVVSFCHSNSDSDEVLFDIKNSISLIPDACEESDGRRAYDFEGDQFFNLMMAYDDMLITYADSFGGMDSAMQSLEGFNKRIKQQIIF